MERGDASRAGAPWCINEEVTSAVETPSGHPPSGPTQHVKAKRSSLLKGLIKTIRPHQWVKNVFVLAPMFFHKDLVSAASERRPVAEPPRHRHGAPRRGVFCLLAGAVYTINDLVDVEADRIHPVKREPPDRERHRARRASRGRSPLALVAVALGISFWKLNYAFAAVARSTSSRTSPTASS